MPLFNPFSQRLYLRIWLAVVGGMVVLTLVVAWAWRIASEQNAQQGPTPHGRETVLLSPTGEVLLRGMASRRTGGPGEMVEFRITDERGDVYTMQVAPPPPRADKAGRPGGRPGTAPPVVDRTAFWLRPPFGFLWLLGIAGVAVALGVFPIIRRLTQRLEALQRSVKKFGEGDLSVRVPEKGQDEVADLARQFNAAASRVEALVQSHKSLLANASHELRSPLTRIRMGLELMGGEQPSPAFRAEILRNIAELDQLVDEILLASRLDAHEADVGTIETVDLIGLAAEECARVDADLDVGNNPALEVPGVVKLVRRAVRNLLENARRYSTGPIHVHMERTPAHVLIRVCDQGPGVPPNQRERIFEPFYRLPGASERAGGVGLGLALVRSIAQRHGGTVHCEDNPGGGACFVLQLPLTHAAHDGHARAPLSPNG